MGKQGKQKRRLTQKQLNAALEDLFIKNPTKSFSPREIFELLRVTTHPMRLMTIATLDEMAWEDFITKTDDNNYKINEGGQILDGTFVRKANGKNTVIPDDGALPIFVAERNSMGALHGDKVKVTLMAKRKNHIKEAMVIEIKERAKDRFVGKVRIGQDFATLETPDNLYVTDIIIPIKKLKGAKPNDRVIVKITHWPDNLQNHLMGEVVEVLGPAGTNDVEMHAILAQYGLPYAYPKAVEEAAEKISEDITPDEVERREDFRGVFTCTIDPRDAKDFDDALSLHRLKKGVWEVGVHIADVSHYVKEGSIIDKEAMKRATSIYLVDRTIPMLPEKLCNQICSLRPMEDKLAYSVIFDMDEESRILRHRIRHTVIRSQRRFTYEEVQQILEDNGVKDGTGQPAPPETTEHPYRGEYASQLIMLDKMAKKLRQERFDNGAVRFEREELHFDVDAQGKPIRCYFKTSKDANKLIEEFMLLANKTVAEEIGKKKNAKLIKTFPYRVHENPDPQKLETLRLFASKFGYKVKTGGSKNQTAKSLNKLMLQADGTREQTAIQTVALRAMMKAKYTINNIGHFGLAFDFYTHFTSPIRRYPDTIVHRLLTRYQAGGRSANKQKCEELLTHASDMEVTAQNAERDSIKYKMVEYMQDKIGNTYKAHISGITAYGIYAEIEENHCEGMIPMRDLKDDYYEFDERNYRLIGKRRHHKYQLGDIITIKVAKADLERRLLDFTICE